MFHDKKDKNYQKMKTEITDYPTAKKVLKRIYRKVGVDFYCGCRFDDDEELAGRFRIDTSCGLSARTASPRAFLIEWEHIVPAYSFGKDRECWTRKDCEFAGKKIRGRKCCERTDSDFKLIEADLHNLVPVPGEINNDRAHYFFGEIEGEKRDYGTCDFEVDFKNQIAEPREEIRGDIARIFFYMEKQWNIAIPFDKRTLYEKWNKLDPPSTFEIRKNDLIEKSQGRRNPFID
ncbi:endonuclease [Leptospira ilyithenensis]|nr:endonuclease [Leptospira ilyithenensis]